MEAIVSKTETLELKVTEISQRYKNHRFQITKKDHDMNDLIGYGACPSGALEDYLDSYESRYNVSRSDINYKWS